MDISPKPLFPRRVALIVSTRDPAGMNIRTALLRHFPFSEGPSFAGHPVLLAKSGKGEIALFTGDEDSIHMEGLDKEISAFGFQADVMIFCTKHMANGGAPSFTCHAPGNWGANEMGGLPRTLCPAPASLLKATFRGLRAEAATMGWNASMEATHHGPCLDTPAMFVEIGPGSAEWPVAAAGEGIARTLTGALLAWDFPSAQRSAVVLGGGHYSHYAEKMQLESAAAAGHICPKFALPSLDRAMLRQALEKSEGRDPFVLLDWKGLGREKKRILALLEQEKIPFERADRFFRAP